MYNRVNDYKLPRLLTGVVIPALTTILLPSGMALAQERELALDEMVVLGDQTRSRSVLDSTSPIKVYDQEDLQKTDALGNELGQALADLDPSFQFPRQSNSVTSDHIKAATLKGMSPDQVLVLVNGKRRHTSAVVNDNTKIGRGTNAFDFNTIPTSAVERVEILEGSASARYGSDAIAGVINIILKDDPEGGSVGVSYGAHHTDVAPIDETVTDGQTLSFNADYGQRINDSGRIRFGIELRDRSSTNRAGFDRVSPFIPQTEDNLQFEGERTHRVGDPDTEDYKAWFNGEYRVGDTRFYGFGTFLHRDTEGAVVYRYPDSNQNVRAIFPSGFRPTSTGENQDTGVTVGAERRVLGWQSDLSLSYGHNDFEFGVENSLNPSLGPASPTSFDSGEFIFEQTQLSLTGNRETRLAGRPTYVTIGTAWRHERFESNAGDEASFEAGNFQFDPSLAAQVGNPDIGAQGAKGLTPADAQSRNRDVGSLFTDISIDVTEQFTGDAALRYENYSDFGDTTTGSVGGLYELTPRTNVRANAATSFRAPSLAQKSWSRRDNTFGPNGERISSRIVRPDSAIAQALGVKQLEEETANSYNLGITSQVSPSINVTLDVFRIDVDDRITLSESIQNGAGGTTTLENVIGGLEGGDGVQSVSFFTNAVDTRTEGFKAVAGWSPRLTAGSLEVNAAFTYSDTEIEDTRNAPSQITAINPGAGLVGVEERNTLETATPERRATLSADWKRGRWNLFGRLRYNSEVKRVFTFAEQEFDAETVMDVRLGYDATQDLTLSVGARNLFDNYPEQSRDANDFFGNFAYDPLNPSGINGRFVFASLDWDY